MPVFSTLRSRLLLLLALMLLPALGVSVHTQIEARDRAFATAREDAEKQVQLMVRQHRALIEGSRQLLAAMSLHPDLRDPGRCSAFARELLRRQRGFLNFGAADLKGDVYCTAVSRPDPKVNVADRDWFQQALSRRDFVPGSYLVGRYTGKPTITHSYPLLDPDGTPRGAIFASAGTAWLDDLVRSIALPDGAVASVIERSGLVLARSADAERWVGQTLPDSELVRALAGSPETGATMLDGLDGVRRLYVFARLETARRELYAGVGVDVRSYYRRVDLAFLRNVALLFAAAAGIWLLAAWATRPYALVRVDELLRGGAAAMPALPGRFSAWRIAIGYGLVATLWIAFSDTLVGQFTLSTETLFRVGVAKGVAFVVVTMLLLRFFIERNFSRLQQTGTALGESELRYRILAETFPVGVFHTDAAGRCVYVNPRWSEITGLSSTEAGRSGWNAALHPADASRIAAAWRAAVADGGRFFEEYRFRRANDAAVVWVQGEAGALRNSAGAVFGYVGTITDISERKRVEEQILALNAELETRVEERTQALSAANLALEEHAAEVADLYNNAPCGYHSLNAEALVERINDTELQWLGYRREEVLGRLHFIELLTPASQALFRESFPRFQQSGYVRDLEFDLRRKDGSTLPVLVSATAIRDAGGNFLRSRSMVFDNTERKARQREIELLNAQLVQRADTLEALNQELESFSYSVSHDLRAPLRAISGFSSIVRRRHAAALSEEGAHYLDNIIVAGERMERLIDDLLKYSRTGRSAVRLQPLPVAAVLDGVCKDLAGPLQQAGATLLIPPDLPLLQADATLLRQVLQNLIDNAITYRRPEASPAIEIGWCQAAAEGGETRLWVRDNGIGIGAEFHEKIFEMFQRLHGPDAYPGTGIGLALVKKAMRLMGGRVWVESVVGEGSKFILAFPHADTR